jgi:TrmH family RNA methyltransferase
MLAYDPPLMSVVPGPPHGLQAIEAARRDPDLVVLEGFHAVKHALRFGAEVTDVFAADIARATALAAELAPDLVTTFASRTVATTEDEIRRVAPHTPTAVVGVARRPHLDLETLVATRGGGSPLVLLEDPRNLGNVGAAVRVAAAADVGGVLTTGRADPWDPAALRGSAGLHFALPVGRIEALWTERPVIGLDPGGEPLRPSELPGDAVLAFGSERAGLSEALRDRCTQRLALPMRDGVSSLNLATAVAAVLFAWRLGGDRAGA